MKGIIDIHSHIGRFDNFALYNVAKAWQEAGVEWVIAVGEDEETSQAAIDVAWGFPQVLAAVGLHPWKVGEVIKDPKDLSALNIFEDLASDPQVALISEVGLDTHFTDTSLELQKEVLSWFIKLAARTTQAIVMHLIAPARELVEVWDTIEQKKPKAAIHSFVGSLDDAKLLTENGFYLSVGPLSLGLVEGMNFKVDDEVVRAIPADRILFDSDAYPETGKTPELTPDILNEVVSQVAKIRHSTPEALIEQVAKNFWDFVIWRPK